MDFRTVLDDPAVDALVIAAPDHWHAPAAILALQAGKHVYLEKPAFHNPREGELLVEAARKSGRTVQVGTQRRSLPADHRGHAAAARGGDRPGLLRQGAGTPTTAAPSAAGRPSTVPSNLDYDLWQGPAPRRPYQDNVVHYNWHWFWHWGTARDLQQRHPR